MFNFYSIYFRTVSQKTCIQRPSIADDFRIEKLCWQRKFII